MNKYLKILRGRDTSFFRFTWCGKFIQVNISYSRNLEILSQGEKMTKIIIFRAALN